MPTENRFTRIAVCARPIGTFFGSPWKTHFPSWSCECKLKPVRARTLIRVPFPSHVLVRPNSEKILGKTLSPRCQSRSRTRDPQVSQCSSHQYFRTQALARDSAQPQFYSQLLRLLAYRWSRSL